MYREFAYGVYNRHFFDKSEALEAWEGKQVDVYVSLFEYDENVLKFYAENQSLRNYNGTIYLPDEFILDVDAGKDGTEYARQKTIALTMQLQERFRVPYSLYFSGTGFHVGIPANAFRWQPSEDLHTRIKKLFKSNGIYDLADVSVTDKTQLIRLVNTRNSKTGLYKIQITQSELEGDLEHLYELAKRPREKFIYDTECDPVFDLLVVTPDEKRRHNAEKGVRRPDPVNYPCIQEMLSGENLISRHKTALRIVSHLKKELPEEYVREIMYSWLDKVKDNGDREMTQDEIDKIIDYTYDANNGDGYNFGCNDEVMEHHCKATCRLYRMKHTEKMHDAGALEDDYVKFITSDVKPIDLGTPFGLPTYPVYPGEFVILQAPPKHMKTTLVQNWVYEFKRRTYFLELEMSKRQMWNTFLQIHTGKDEEYLRENYQDFIGVSEKFGWLTMDFNRCRAEDIKKRVLSLPYKPEIIVVDHMHRLGGFIDTHTYNHEVSNILSNLAVKENIIVIAIAEIDKASMYSGQHIGSVKGGAAAVYDANKVIAITKAFRNSEGLITALTVKDFANREKETLHGDLEVYNKKIVGRL